MAADRIARLWTFYQVMAVSVGTVLAVLSFIALPYRYLVLREEASWYQYAWMAHGYLFPAYLVATLLLGQALRWPMRKLIVVMLAGTVPLMSFFTERRLAREIR